MIWINCCVPHCRRKARGEKHPNAERPGYEIICGRCWRTIDPRLRARYKTLKIRDRRIDSIIRLKKIRAKPGFDRQIGNLVGLFDRAHGQNWAALKEDATIKSNMRVEGTAGDLAARRKVALQLSGILRDPGRSDRAP